MNENVIGYKFTYKTKTGNDTAIYIPRPYDITFKENHQIKQIVPFKGKIRPYKDAEYKEVEISKAMADKLLKLNEMYEDCRELSEELTPSVMKYLK